MLYMVNESGSLFRHGDFQHRNQAFGDTILHINDRVPQVLIQAGILTLSLRLLLRSYPCFLGGLVWTLGVVM